MRAKEILFGLLGLLCLGYCAVVYLTQSGTKMYLVWLALALGFFCLVPCVHLSLWSRLPLPLRRVAVGAVALAIGAFVLVEGCIFSGFSAKGEAGLDYIIVLGAQVYQNGPSSVLRYRLDVAYEYLVENEDTLCIVSGGQGSNEPWPEAKGMYDYLVAKGIDPERILVEDTSRDTLENLTNSSAYFDAETASVGIVTNNFHVFRSVHLARKLGFGKVCGIAAGISPLHLPNNLLREFFGVTKDLLQGDLL